MNEIHIDLAGYLPLVMADPQRIVQVLGNLLSECRQVLPQCVPDQGRRRAGEVARGLLCHRPRPGRAGRTAAAPVQEVLPDRQ